MLTTKEAKKIPFEQLDDESQTHFYEQFKRYVVRKQIADTNKELTSLFAKRLGTNNPRNYAHCFNDFNTSFVNANLIGQLHYDEVHSDFLRGLSEENFNAYLKRNGGSFERKVALICYSSRPSERIANRLEYPVMQAYANMQTMVKQLASANSHSQLHDIFHISAKTIRTNYKNEHGTELNKSKIADERTDYKSLGKKTAPIWKSMLEYYKAKISELDPNSALQFVSENFIFTQADMQKFLRQLEENQRSANCYLTEIQQLAETLAEESPDYYNIADYEEAYSAETISEVYADATSNAINALFNKYLSDPIFAPKQEKSQNGQIKT